MTTPTTNLSLFQLGTQFTAKNGFLTPVAAHFIQLLMTRVGGAAAPSNTQISNSVTVINQSPALLGAAAPSMPEYFDDGESFVIPGPVGPVGPQGIPGPVIFWPESSDEGDWVPIFGPKP